MLAPRRKPQLMLALIATLALIAGDALAEKPARVGKDKGRGGAEARASVHLEVRFDEARRAAIRDYYGRELRAGNCPPGLRKKRNGCMPPGQAKKWQIGHPLPRDVIFHDLPPRLVVEIGAPPPGYRFVRVASDILMIAVGTGMVIDAITDLHQL